MPEYDYTRGSTAPQWWQRALYFLGATTLWMVVWGLGVAPSLGVPTLSWMQSAGVMLLAVCVRLAWRAVDG